MNGKGCNLMVPPSNVPHTLGALTGQQLSPTGGQSHPSGSSSLRHPSGPAVGVQSQTVGGPVQFPSLSLRRQVLTNGKNHDILSFPQSSWKQETWKSSLSLPPATSVSSSNQGTRAKCLESCGKGEKLWQVYFLEGWGNAYNFWFSYIVIHVSMHAHM